MTIITDGRRYRAGDAPVAEKLEKRMQELRWYDRTKRTRGPGSGIHHADLLDSTPPSEVREEFYQAQESQRRGG